MLQLRNNDLKINALTKPMQTYLSNFSFVCCQCYNLLKKKKKKNTMNSDTQVPIRHMEKHTILEDLDVLALVICSVFNFEILSPVAGNRYVHV